MPKLKKNKVDYHAQFFNFQTRKNQPNFRSYHFRNMNTKHENYTACQFLECKKLQAVAYFTLLDLYENEKKNIV